MKFVIKEIILWPRKQGLKPRRVSLLPGRVNIISGASKTGKSAIIPIVDYCLASDRCSVPVETIRNACSWFGVLVDTEEGEKLFARREPGGQKSTGDMYVAEGPTVSVPDEEPEKNTTAEAVKSKLDELSGLSRLDFDFEKSGSGFKGRPSFRDLVAFTFQPQNIVANPDVLFFKADTYEHREKLKTIFPYVLKAVSPETLAAQHELESVRRVLARKERELLNLQQVSEQWNAELRAWAVQAREYGLLKNPLPPGVDRGELIELLQGVCESKVEVSPSKEGIGEAVQELVELEREESEVDTLLRNLRRRLSEMSKLKENAGQFKDSLAIQRDRLAVSKWVSSLEDVAHICPICSSPTEHDQRLDELLEAMRKVEVSVEQAGAVSSSFDREMVRVKDEVSLCTERLKGISLRKREVQARSQAGQDAHFRQSAISRFLGRIERGLEMQKTLGHDGALAEEVGELKKREQQLARLISKEGLAERRRRALERIAMLAGRLLPGLDTERPNDPIELSITDLTIKVKGPTRDDFLWEIGSGANWLSYHVSLSLALQQFFIQNSPSPVPSFLVYDQPSQVYFPRRLARNRSPGPEEEPTLKDEDVEAVRKVISTIAQVVLTPPLGLQTLILDHAGPEIWEGIEGVHFVEEWRQGKKLVPAEWL